MGTESAIVVADAGPLIHLDELASLDVLSDYPKIFVPEAVWIEVEHHRPHALIQPLVKLIRQPPAPSSAKVNAMTTFYTLHHGEHEALTLCVHHEIKVLLSDDTAARLAAESLDIATHGTLGLLIRAVRRNMHTPSEVLEILKAIPLKSTLHIRPSLLENVIKKVKEEWGSRV